MAGKKKRPKLRFNGRYYVANIYKPDGKRTMISFGPLGERTESEIRIAFETWLDLFEEHPHKVLDYNDPYDAIAEIINPINVTSVRDLLDKYDIHQRKIIKPTKNGRIHPDLMFLNRVGRFLEKYNDWSVDSFGPDELEEVKQALVNHEFKQGNTTKKYFRRGINDTIKWIRNIWEWGEGRRLVYGHTVQGLKEVKLLKMGDSGTIDRPKRKRLTDEEFLKVINAINSVVGDIDLPRFFGPGFMRVFPHNSSYLQSVSPGRHVP